MSNRNVISKLLSTCPACNMPIAVEVSGEVTPYYSSSTEVEDGDTIRLKMKVDGAFVKHDCRKVVARGDERR